MPRRRVLLIDDSRTAQTTLGRGLASEHSRNGERSWCSLPGL